MDRIPRLSQSQNPNFRAHFGIPLLKPILATWLADRLQLPACGPEVTITAIAELRQAQANALTFSKEQSTSAEGIAIVAPDSFHFPQCCHLASVNPRLDFIRAFQLLEAQIGFKTDSEGSHIHPSVEIGQNVFIEPGVEIGEGTKIYHNVTIRRGVKIGKHCLIKSGSVLGEEGFGFERDEEGAFERMPHWGGVRLGDHVEIGSLVTICRGVLSETRIDDGVKIDDHCHIAHHCHIGAHTLLAAGVVLCGSVSIGEQCWIAPRATILNKLHIGRRAFVGLGAVVTQDVAPETTVFGNPAKQLLRPLH